MESKKTVIQIGLGSKAEFADLLLPEKRSEYTSIIPNADESDWDGIFVDAHSISFAKAAVHLCENYPNEKLMLVNAPVSSQDIVFFDTNSYTVSDEHCHLSGSKIERAERRDLYSTFLTGGIRLDKIVQLAPNPIGLLAMDIQGMEMEVLSDYSWSVYPENMIIEPHSEDRHAFILSLMDSHGYELVGERLPWNKSANLIFRR